MYKIMLPVFIYYGFYGRTCPLRRLCDLKTWFCFLWLTNSFTQSTFPDYSNGKLSVVIQNNLQLADENLIYFVNSLVCYHTNTGENLIYDCLTCKSSACTEVADPKRMPTNANSLVTLPTGYKLSETTDYVMRTLPASKFCFVSIIISENLAISLLSILRCNYNFALVVVYRRLDCEIQECTNNNCFYN